MCMSNSKWCWPTPGWSSQTCQVVWFPGRCRWPACTCDRQGSGGTSCWQCPQGEGRCFSSPHLLATRRSPHAAWCSDQCTWLGGDTQSGIGANKMTHKESLLVWNAEKTTVTLINHCRWNQLLKRHPQSFLHVSQKATTFQAVILLDGC